MKSWVKGGLIGAGIVFIFLMAQFVSNQTCNKGADSTSCTSLEALIWPMNIAFSLLFGIPAFGLGALITALIGWLVRRLKK